MPDCKEFARTLHQELSPGSSAPSIASAMSGSIAALHVRVERDTVLTTRPLPVLDGWLFCLSERGTMLEYPPTETYRRCSATGARSVFDMNRNLQVQIATLDALMVVVSRQALLEVAHSMNASPPDLPLSEAPGVATDESMGRLGQLLSLELGLDQKRPALFIEHLLQAFAVHVAMTYAHVTPGSRAPRGGLATWQLRKAQQMLRASLCAPIRLNLVAEACQLSVSHFSRAFRQSTGMAPYAWLQHQRIATAKTLLQLESGSLSDIAAACGFSDQSHFTRVFHRTVGASPGAWRRVVIVSTR